MLELDRTVRDTKLFNLFYARLQLLGSNLNSRVRGGPLFTIVSALVAMVSDAMEEVAQLYHKLNPATTSGDFQDEVLGFFERPRYQATACEQTFTLLRKAVDASSPVVVPLGAAIQTSVQQDGQVRSYTITAAADSATMGIGQWILPLVFKASDPGALSVISSAQLMEIASGFSGVQVISGRWIGAAGDPLLTLGDVGSETIEKWLINNAQFFEQNYRVMGRDKESDPDHYERCIERWSEQSVGSTDLAYESWAKNYVDPVTGSTPFAAAKVTTNQTFSSVLGKHPTLQPLQNAFTYFMGVEVAVALTSGTVPSPSQLQALADYLFTTKPHTDKVWVRGPNQILVASTDPVLCAVTYKGPVAMQSQIFDLVLSFFLYDSTRASNYRGLGGAIYKSDLVYAIRALSPEIYDVHIAFILAGKLDAQGDIKLVEFDQIIVQVPTASVTVVAS